MAGPVRAPCGRPEGAPCSRRVGKGQALGDTFFHAPGGCGLGPPRPFYAKGLFPQVKAIADTGFLVAFANRNDTHHAWAIGVAEAVTEPLLTCEAVLAETAFHLGSSAKVLAFVREGLVRPALVLGEHLSRLEELAKRYADRKPDLADLCLIRLSELHPKHPVITTDLTDFRVYRRGRREAIPLIYPPGR